MAKIDIDGDGKADFSISLTQIIALCTIFASIIGSYYTLSAKVDKAMLMPPTEVSKKDLDALRTEYDLKIEKVQIQASENMDEIKSLGRELRNNYKLKK
jgi:predicted RND superfamily exporter protein